jgi:hypothetical protein
LRKFARRTFAKTDRAPGSAGTAMPSISDQPHRVRASRLAACRT